MLVTIRDDIIFNVFFQVEGGNYLPDYEECRIEE